MSNRVYRCGHCKKDCDFQYSTTWGYGILGVQWFCQSCDKYESRVDVFPVGSLAPHSGECLNCGAQRLETDSNVICPSCGIDTTEFASIPRPSNVTDVLSDAEDLLRRGAARRGLALINQVLLDDPTCSEAWDLKVRFLTALDLHDLVVEMLIKAMSAGMPVGTVGSYLELLLQHGQWSEVVAVTSRLVPHIDDAAASIDLVILQGHAYAELDDSQSALASADAALRVDPANPGAHSLRGRALALLGRLAEARAEMETALTISPSDEYARAALEKFPPRADESRNSPWWRRFL